MRKLCLVIDDSRVVRGFVRKIVEGFGLDVREAEDTKNALKMCGMETPKVIVLDADMEDNPTAELMLKLRETAKSKPMKLILCSTENQKEKIREAIDAGADEYIMKPFDKEILRGKFELLGLLST